MSPRTKLSFLILQWQFSVRNVGIGGFYFGIVAYEKIYRQESVFTLAKGPKRPIFFLFQYIHLRLYYYNSIIP